MSISPVIPGITAAALYLIGTFLQLRTMSHNAEFSVRILTAIGMPALILHGFASYAAINTVDGIDLNLFAVASLVTLIMVVFVVSMSFVRPVHSLLVLLFPLGAITVLASLFAESRFTPVAEMTAGLASHILISITAYSVLMMAAAQAVLVGIIERNIRTKSHILMLRILPPLETMEHLLFAMLWAGFAVLTIAIASGFVYLDNMFAQHVVHHTVLTSASWVIYVVLLGGRHLFGWRGTSAVRWVLGAFVLLLLGYFGSKFVLEIILDQG